MSVSVSLTLEIKAYSIQSIPKDLYLNIQFKYVDSNTSKLVSSFISLFTVSFKDESSSSHPPVTTYQKDF
jgi:hypothetical protein